MNSSMRRPFEPSALTVGQPFASHLSRRGQMQPAQRWDIELVQGEGFRLTFHASCLTSLLHPSSGAVQLRLVAR
jgi:hypothetical protein